MSRVFEALESLKGREDVFFPARIIDESWNNSSFCRSKQNWCEYDLLKFLRNNIGEELLGDTFNERTAVWSKRE